MQKDTGNKNAYIDRAVGLTHCMDMEDMYAEILQDYCSEGIKYQENARSTWHLPIRGLPDFIESLLSVTLNKRNVIY